ncbi:AzlD domain-containing protein [Leucothrix sargassi]|nr:AzlD domain-containing protein [Leucothrix sargassi]
MSYWILILGMAILTFLPRYLPFALAGRTTIPTWLEKALHFVPTAVLTCIIVKATLVQNGEVALSLENDYLIAAIAAFVTSLLTRNLLLTVTIGLLCFGVLKWI